VYDAPSRRCAAQRPYPFDCLPWFCDMSAVLQAPHRGAVVFLIAAVIAPLSLLMATSAAFAEDALSETSFEYRYGRAQQMMRQPDQALAADRLLRLLIAARPKHIGPWSSLGGLMMNNEATRPQSRLLLERAHTLDESSPWPLLYLSTLAEAEGDPEASANYLRAAALASPTDPKSYPIQTQAAHRLATMRRYKDAEEIFLFAAELRPHDPTYVTGLGTMWADQGRYADAIKLFSDALDAKGFHNEIFINRNNAYLGVGRPQDCLDAIAKRRQVAAADLAKDPFLDKTLSVQEGRALIALQRYADAEAALAPLAPLPVPADAQQSGHSVRAHYWSGIALSMRGCAPDQAPVCAKAPETACCQASARAIQHFDAVAQDAFGKDYHKNLPVLILLALEGKGAHAQAEQAIIKHVALRLGLAQLNFGQLIEAEGTLYDQIQASAGSMGEAYAAMAITLLAFADRDGDDRDRQQALRLYHEATLRAPDFLTPDLLTPRWQWPPYAVDAVRRLKQLSDDETARRKAAEAASSPKTSGCRCQSLSARAPAPTSALALLLSSLALCVTAATRRKRPHPSRPAHA
jgi:tetratricopeptide (TPR) repeat protein